MPCPLVAGPKSIYGDPGQETSRLSQLIQSSTRNGRMMTDVSLDELGPVDYLVVEFPAGESNFTGEMAKELLALVDSGIIRVIDVLILTKDADGAVEAMELSDVAELGELQAIEAQLAELLAEEDVDTTRRGDGAGQHRRSAHLGEPMGCPIRISGAAFGWSTDRQRTDPDSSDHRLHRGRRGNHERRRLNMPLRPARVGRVGVIGAPVAKTAVVAAAVTPGRGAPVAKTAVVAAAVTPGRRRRI